MCTNGWLNWIVGWKWILLFSSFDTEKLKKDVEILANSCTRSSLFWSNNFQPLGLFGFPKS